MDLVGVEITIIAAVYILLSVSLQRKLVDTTRTYETQEIIKAKSKELTELSKSGADQAALIAKQKEITGLLSQSMRSQLKPMFVVLPIFLVLYYLVFPMFFSADLTVMFLSTKLNYRTYFILFSFVLGIVLSIGLMAHDKARMRKSAPKPQESFRSPYDS